MSVIGSNVLAGASGQSAGGGAGGLIPRSLRFNSGDDSYLSRQPSSAGDRKKWTWSGWVKRSRLNGNQSLFTAAYPANETLLIFDNSNRLVFWNFVSGSYAGQKTSTAVFRDCSAWYHIVLVWDSGNSTAADRIKIYVNGTRIDTFSTSVDPAQNTESIVNDVRSHRIGDYSENASYNLDGYQADVHFIDGQALAPTDFGETNTDNLWVPKAYAGTYGPAVNTSQRWSTTITHSTLANTDPAYYAKLYNNNPGNNNGVMGDGGSGGSSFTLTIPGSVVGSTISVTSVYSMSFQVNGGASNVKDTTVALPSGTRTITITGTGGSSATASGVYIDGKLLVDPVNQTKTWSSSTGITDSSGTRSSSYIFDGLIAGSHSNGFNTYNSTITLANSVTATSSIRFYGAFENSSGVYYTVNGTTTNAQPPEFTGNTAFGWASVTNISFPVTINNVGLTDTSTSNGGRFVGIEIDGKLLVDPGVFLVSNSFHLDFADNSSNAALGLDTSGLSPANTWTVNNLIANRESVSTDTIASVATTSLPTVTLSGGFSLRNNAFYGATPPAAGSSASFGPTIGRTTGSMSFSPAITASSKIELWAYADGGVVANSVTINGSATISIPGGSSYAYTKINCNTTSLSSLAFAYPGGATDFYMVGFYVDDVWYGLDLAGTVLTFPSSNNFSGFAVGDVVQAAGSYNRYISSSITPSSPPSISSITDSGSQVFDVLPTDSGGKFLVAELATAADSLIFRYFESNTLTTNPTTYGPSYVSDNGTSWTQVDASFVTGLGHTISNGSPHRYFAVASVAYNSNYSFGNSSSSGNYWTFSDGQGAASITAIDASGPTIKVSAGNWYGSNGSGTSGGSTVLSSTTVTNGDNFVDTPVNGDTASDTGAGGEVVGNYAMMNILNPYKQGTLSNGNLEVSGAGGWHGIANIGMSSGKWYAEVTGLTGGGSSDYEAGISDITQLNSSQVFDYFSRGYGYRNDAQKINSNSAVSYGATYGVGDVIGIAVDLDNRTLVFYKNGVSQGTAFTGIPAGHTYFFACFARGSSDKVAWNFGQRAFAYPLSGYKALCTANLPEPTIADGSKYFDTKLYSGDGTNGRAITGLNYSPDLVWIKARNQADGHNLFDIVRGATKVMKSNNNNVELTESNSLTAFNSDGFTVGNNSSNAQVNASGFTYSAWAWDAGSSNTTIAAGSLNSSLYNQAEAWNSQVTGTSQSYDFGGGGARGNNYIFDGDIKHASSALSGNTITWTGSIAFTSSFAIASDNDGADPSVTAPYNAVNITHGPSNTITNVRSQLPNTANSQLAAGTIPLTVLTGITSPVTKIECVGGTQGANGLTQVVADGRMLVDSGITLANVPSRASTVRANPSAGFSIVSFTANGTAGTTIAHNLNAVPEFVVVKDREYAQNWQAYHGSLGGTKMFNWNTTDSVYTDAGGFNNTNPTSSVITLGNYSGYFGTNEMIAYCFAPVEGYSSMGSFVGNGSADGPFVYTGMRPSWLLIKLSSGSSDWRLFDTERDPYNVADTLLFPSGAEAEYTDSTYHCDILSNGFKMRNTHSGLNASGSTYLYIAFASNPFASNGGLAR